MKLSELSPIKFRNIISTITPEIKDIMAVITEFSTERAEASKTAEKVAIKHNLLMKKPPAEVTNDEVDELAEMQATATRIESKFGATAINIILDKLILEKFDSVLRVLAALYEMKAEDIEKKTLEDITNMIAEALQDRLLLRFFPQLRLLAQKIQSDT